MVDLESHRIIDLIPSRDVADVKEWLNKYSNLNISPLSVERKEIAKEIKRKLAVEQKK